MQSESYSGLASRGVTVAIFDEARGALEDRPDLQNARLASFRVRQRLMSSGPRLRIALGPAPAHAALLPAAGGVSHGAPRPARRAGWNPWNPPAARSKHSGSGPALGGAQSKLEVQQQRPCPGMSRHIHLLARERRKGIIGAVCSMFKGGHQRRNFCQQVSGFTRTCLDWAFRPHSDGRFLRRSAPTALSPMPRCLHSRSFPLLTLGLVVLTLGSVACRFRLNHSLVPASLRFSSMHQCFHV